MDKINERNINRVKRPIKVLQIGEGNFLRAFVDYFIDVANEKGVFNGNVVIVKPTDHGNLDKFHDQDCMYTVSLRGMVDGQAKEMNRIITSVADAVSPYTDYNKYEEYIKLDTLRFVVSNTTEAGIVYDPNDQLDMEPPKSFPGKLTKLLYTRFRHFQGDNSKGLIMLPVELIDDNGTQLKHCVLKYASQWNLGDEFVHWVHEACIFTSTLVDRIVTGYPVNDEQKIFESLGYEDRLYDAAEPFGLWVIESEKSIEEAFPLQKAGLPIVYTDNLKPFKQRKVRILNGAHTSFVLASYMAGNNIVLESMNDPVIYQFMKHTIFDEVIPTLALPKEMLEEFAEAIIERFRNPYVKHALLAISLNSISKWKARCMPSFLEYRKKFDKLPSHLTFSIAALMAFYTGSEIRGNALIGHRGAQEYEIKDDEKVLKFFAQYSQMSAENYACAVLGNREFWGIDLADAATCQKVGKYLKEIRTIGMRETLMNEFPIE